MPPPNPSPAPARRGRKPKPRLVELRITVARIEPPIWRSVRVPDAYTLRQLHRVIQFVFGWLDYHLYTFGVGDRRFEPLDEAENEDSTAIHLRDLALGTGARFTYTYGLGVSWVHEIEVKDVYIYTPMDGDPRVLPVLFGGERAGPPEDYGPEGYAEMLRARGDPDHPSTGSTASGRATTIPSGWTCEWSATTSPSPRRGARSNGRGRKSAVPSDR